MTDKQYTICVTEAQNYTNRDAYISDMALSSVWCDSPDAQTQQDRLDQLGSVYDAVHRSVKDVAAAAGISVRAMAIRFCIPIRTAESWCGTTDAGRQCPLYTRLMMQECLGLIKR